MNNSINTVDPNEVKKLSQMFGMFGLDPAQMQQMMLNSAPGIDHLPTVKYTDGTVLRGRKL